MPTHRTDAVNNSMLDPERAETQAVERIKLAAAIANVREHRRHREDRGEASARCENEQEPRDGRREKRKRVRADRRTKCIIVALREQPFFIHLSLAFVQDARWHSSAKERRSSAHRSTFELTVHLPASSQRTASAIIKRIWASE